jgi:hypothetical protein
MVCMVVRRVAMLLAALALMPVWADVPGAKGGPAQFHDGPAANLKHFAGAYAVARSVQESRAIPPRRGEPEAKTVASGLYMAGHFSATFSSGSVTVTLDRINNDTLLMTGTLRLDLWATAVPPARAAGFGGYRLASFSTFSSLLPRTNYSNITRTAAVIEPPAGTYWLVLTLTEWDPSACPAVDHFCLEDSLVSDSVRIFTTPPATVTLLSASNPLCFENVPSAVAAELQRQAPGVYIPYSSTTSCASLGVPFFAGYLADSGNTVLVFTDNATNAALLCASNIIVGCTVGTTTGAYTDLWWTPEEPGWGVSITHHTSGVAFVAWYTYDSAGKPKWYVVSNCVMSSSGCSGTLYETTGPPFGPTFDPAQVVTRYAGSLTFSFSSLNAGTMRYDLNGQMGTKAISRQPF